MIDLNLCQFIGNITRDLDIKYMPNGEAVLNFSIACNDDYKKDNEEIKVVNFIDLVAFRKPAEIIERYCKKGSKIYVAGKQRTRTWQDAKGDKRYKTEVVIDKIQFLDSKSTDKQSTESNQPRPTASQPIDNGGGGDSSFDDDIPF